MKKKIQLKNGKTPLLLRRYSKFSVLLPAKNWFKNFINRRTILSKNDFEIISKLGWLAFLFFISILIILVATGFFGISDMYSTEIAISTLLNTSFLYVYALLPILPIPLIILGRLGKKGRFKDDERVELKLSEHLSKHLDKIPEELIHEYYDSKMDFQNLKKVLDEIDIALSKGMSYFLRQDLLKKRNEVLQEAKKSQNYTEKFFSQIESVTNKFAEIDKIHQKQYDERKKQAEIREHDKEVLEILTLLSENNKSKNEVELMKDSNKDKQRLVY